MSKTRRIPRHRASRRAATPKGETAPGAPWNTRARIGQQVAAGKGVRIVGPSK